MGAALAKLRSSSPTSEGAQLLPELPADVPQQICWALDLGDRQVPSQQYHMQQPPPSSQHASIEQTRAHEQFFKTTLA